jgi:lysophospholipase L1-like esterase
MSERPPQRLVRWIFAGCALFSALSIALWFVRPPPLVVDQAVLDDPRVRDRVVELFARRVGGTYDSHNDPDVGRVLQKNLVARAHGLVTIDTNRFGLREWDYPLPKPPGAVRVVLLGDSFVFGTGAESEDRPGAHLQRWLRERSGREDIGVLHIGILSWDVVAEASYVRRQLSLLQPDLVIQVSLDNDLDDVPGVRGFGAVARYATRHRERADAIVRAEFPSVHMGLSQRVNFLCAGHDAESRERWEAAERAVWRLATEVERAGGKYLHVFRWPGANQKARALIGKRLTDEQVAFLSTAFRLDPSSWVAPDDIHWNAKAGREVALVCYGLIVERHLLPTLELEHWDEASEAVARIHEAALTERSEALNSRPKLDALLSLEDLAAHPEEGAHVYGGIDGQGLVAPFASVSLQKPRMATSVRLRAECLERPEIDGATVRVSAEGVALGVFEIRAGQSIDASWPLPTELADARYLDVRLEADDYCYTGDDLQQCVVMRLLSLSVE